MTYRLETYSDIGAMLRDVRENYELSLEEIARALNLDKKYVVALEAGNIRALPGMTYARGYIRNYALLLGINADELLSQFEAAGPQVIARKFMPVVQEKDSVPQGWVVAASLGVFLLMVLLFSGDSLFSGSDGDVYVQPVPEEVLARSQRKQAQVEALPACFELMLAKRAPLCYYQREIRQLVLQPRREFSTALALRTVSERLMPEKSMPVPSVVPIQKKPPEAVTVSPAATNVSVQPVRTVLPPRAVEPARVITPPAAPQRVETPSEDTVTWEEWEEE